MLMISQGISHFRPRLSVVQPHPCGIIRRLFPIHSAVLLAWKRLASSQPLHLFSRCPIL